MALKFLNKKGWHPSNLRNQEKVWKAEQKQEAEQKKLEELRKQIDEDRKEEELRQLREQAGLAPLQQRVDFLYESGLATGKASADEYMLGKRADDLLQAKEKQPDLSKASNVPGALFAGLDVGGGGSALGPEAEAAAAAAARPSANEMWQRLHSDPLLLIRQQEQQALKRIRHNPVQMEAIRKEAERAKKKKKGESKEERKRRKEEKRRERKERKRRKKEKAEGKDKGGKPERVVPDGEGDSSSDSESSGREDMPREDVLRCNVPRDDLSRENVRREDMMRIGTGVREASWPGGGRVRETSYQDKEDRPASRGDVLMKRGFGDQDEEESGKKGSWRTGRSPERASAGRRGADFRQAVEDEDNGEFRREGRRRSDSRWDSRQGSGKGNGGDFAGEGEGRRRSGRERHDSSDESDDVGQPRPRGLSPQKNVEVGGWRAGEEGRAQKRQWHNSGDERDERRGYERHHPVRERENGGGRMVEERRIGRDRLPNRSGDEDGHVGRSLLVDRERAEAAASEGHREMRGEERAGRQYPGERPEWERKAVREDSGAGRRSQRGNGDEIRARDNNGANDVEDERDDERDHGNLNEGRGVKGQHKGQHKHQQWQQQELLRSHVRNDSDDDGNERPAQLPFGLSYSRNMPREALQRRREQEQQQQGKEEDVGEDEPRAAQERRVKYSSTVDSQERENGSPNRVGNNKDDRRVVSRGSESWQDRGSGGGGSGTGGKGREDGGSRRGKLSEEEKQRRLREMMESAEANEAERLEMVRWAAEREAREERAHGPLRGHSSFLRDAQKEIYGASSGRGSGGASVEDAIRRRAHFLEKGGAGGGGGSNVFRR